jgi:PTS system nitrogen regulatory IIA component
MSFHSLSAMALMKIEDFLARENALIDLKAGDKARALADLSARAAAALGLSSEAITQEILKREALGSTGVGGGVAIPHARLRDLRAPLGVVARLKRPIEFDAIDQKPVDLIFVLLTPPSEQGDHLNALAAIARKLRDPERLKLLRAAPDNDAFYQAMIT